MPIVATRLIVARQSAAARPIHRPDVVARSRVRRPVVESPSEIAPEPVVAPAQRPAAKTTRAEATCYEIGYRKPPAHTRFKKGQSGNRRGRPKGAKGLKTLVREMLTERVKVRTSTGIKTMIRMEAMLHKVMEQALSGNFRALQQLITLYGTSVPDDGGFSLAPLPGPAGSSSPLSAVESDQHDLAILDGLKAIMAAEMKAQP